jgi:hypothetical protein
MFWYAKAQAIPNLKITYVWQLMVIVPTRHKKTALLLSSCRAIRLQPSNKATDLFARQFNLFAIAAGIVVTG